MFVIRTKLGGSRSLREDYNYEINRGAHSVSWRGLCARVKWRGSLSHASYEVLARGVVDSSLGCHEGYVRIGVVEVAYAV